MYNHEPADYECPLCELIAGIDNPDPWNKQSDVFYRDEDVIAFLNVKWWGSIEGNAVVVPNRHVENIFEVPTELAGHIHAVAQKVATAFMETYGCAGISTRQHNGPAGNQDVWHYHLHVFPRNDRTELYGAPSRMSTLDERLPYAQRLHAWFAGR